MANFAQKFKNMWNPPEDEYDYEESETVTETQDHSDSDSSSDSYQDIDSHSYETSSYDDRRSSSSSDSGNVVNFSSSNNVQVVLFKPMDYREDTKAIADELVRANTVVLNLEVTQKETARRVLDFLGGVAYAKNGKVRRVSTNTYIITPHNVDLIGVDDDDTANE